MAAVIRNRAAVVEVPKVSVRDRPKKEDEFGHWAKRLRNALTEYDSVLKEAFPKDGP